MSILEDCLRIIIKQTIDKNIEKIPINMNGRWIFDE